MRKPTLDELSLDFKRSKSMNVGITTNGLSLTVVGGIMVCLDLAVKLVEPSLVGYRCQLGTSNLKHVDTSTYVVHINDGEGEPLGNTRQNDNRVHDSARKVKCSH